MGWGGNVFPLLVVTASGGFTGLYVYSPAPGRGNLVAYIAAQQGTDPFGNPVSPSLALEGLPLLAYGLLASGGIVNVLLTGSGNWTAPAGVTSVTVQDWGGGQGGFNSGDGGTGGEYAKQVLAVTPGNLYAYSQGAAGAANGGLGGTSTFGPDDNGVSVVAHGGGTGLFSTNTVHFPGGTSLVHGGLSGASGGGSGGYFSAGNNGSPGGAQTPAVSGGGFGGQGGTGHAGGPPGGGGGGGAGASSGAGAAGQIQLTYSTAGSGQGLLASLSAVAGIDAIGGTYPPGWTLGGLYAQILASGDTSGVTDSTNILQAYAAGYRVVQLMQGVYNVNQTIIVPTGCALIGANPVQADNFSPVPGVLQAQGTVITAVGAFTAGPVAGQAVVACTNSTTTQQGGQVLANFSIAGSGIPAGAGTFGILINGAVGAGVISNVTVIRGDGANLRFRQDATSLILPDQWTIENCTFAGSRSSHGVQADDIADSNFINCYSHDNKLDGYNIGASVNLQMLGCRGETNSGNAFHFTGLLAAGQRLFLTGCVSELNAGSGYLFDATGPGGTALGTYQLANCSSYDDGTSGTTQGGYWSNGCKSRIMMTGCKSDVGGTQNAFGAYEGNVSYGMALTGCYMHGGTGATHDDGTNTNVLSNLVPVPF